MLHLVFIALLQAATVDPAQAQAPETDPASAQQTAQEPTQQTSQPSPHERVRCRSEVITGTRLTRRVCTTPAEDAAQEAEGRSFVNRLQSQNPLQSN